VPCSMQLDKERNATSTPEGQAGVLVVHKHHLLVRCSHWLNVPILPGLILSGLSIYWASPVYQHKPDPLTGNVDPLADIGIWICTHVPGSHHYGSPPDWVYNHISLGPGMLALAVVGNPQVIQIGTGVSVPTSRLVWSDRQRIKPNSPEVALEEVSADRVLGNALVTSNRASSRMTE
jgi:hypothetical protein